MRIGDGMIHKKTRSYLIVVVGIIFLFAGFVRAEEASDLALVQAQRAYDQGKFQQVVDFVKPLLKGSSTSSFQIPNYVS